jgi:hypothetical protein
MVDRTSRASQYQRGVLRILFRRIENLLHRSLGRARAVPLYRARGAGAHAWEHDEADLQCSVEWDRGLRAIIYICRAPSRWQFPPFRHNSRLHAHTQVARTGCLDCTLKSPRPCNPNAALLDLFLFLSLFLSPIPGDRCCAALTSTYPTKPRLDCARSLETPRYDS